MTETVATDMQQLANDRIGFGGAHVGSRHSSWPGVWLAAPLPLARWARS